MSGWGERVINKNDLIGLISYILEDKMKKILIIISIICLCFGQVFCGDFIILHKSSDNCEVVINKIYITRFTQCIYDDGTISTEVHTKGINAYVKEAPSEILKLMEK